MAVKIRLTRIGKKRHPVYRVVVTDSRSPRDGRYIEQIGRYEPLQEPSLVEIDTDRAAYWLGTGAQPTSQARKLLEIAGAVKAPVKGKAAKAAKPAEVHVVGEDAQKAAEADDATVLARAQAAAEAADEAAADGDSGEPS